MLRNVYCGTYFAHVETCNVFEGLKWGYLNGGFPSTFRGDFRGGYVQVGFQGFSEGTKGEYFKEGLLDTFKELKGGYLRVTSKGGLRKRGVNRGRCVSFLQMPFCES